MIGTNEAYQIATNWLTAIDVDVQRLEKEQPVKVTRESWAGNPLPIFDVKWDAKKVDKWGHKQGVVVKK